jgi:predicted regulator of Ras-like GTPase activity (Roadblock/LC7/MglB family)
MLASQARLLEDRLLSLVTRVREIRGLVLLDAEGLVLVSTLGSRSLEESLAGFAAGATTQMRRAQHDFEMGPLYLLHLAGRDRQIFMTPLTQQVSLIAVVEAGAAASSVALHLLGLCCEILGLLHAAPEEGP